MARRGGRKRYSQRYRLLRASAVAFNSKNRRRKAEATIRKLTKRRRKRRWIQKAVNPKHKGLLHRELGVPLGKKIPMSKLRRALRMGGAIARRAQFAINMRKVQRRRRRK